MKIQSYLRKFRSGIRKRRTRRQVLTRQPFEAALLLLIAPGLLAAADGGQGQSIDIQKSILTVRVYKAGVFSMLGHDHEIAARIAGGSVNSARHRVELQVHANALRVRDPNASERDQEEIQKTMLGPEVLDAGHYPEIIFRSKGAERTSSGKWTIRGDLTLHGQTRPIVLDVQDRSGHYVGSAQLKQTEFDMKPVKVAGGTVRVKDEVRVEFDIQVAQ